MTGLYQPASLLVEGRADGRGGTEYKLALSERRAESVPKALRPVGVEPAQVDALPGCNEEAWARNRRLELRPR